ncbi:MAG: PAS domain-containing protein, partial [Rhodobacteraceae bacterium]|nr:PAS domain-containing protein [Paracoccaceae bacterium]
MTDQTPDLWQTLLDNLSDGVLVIDIDGAIHLANPAFCRMFGLEEDGWAGQDFGSLFVLAEGLDEFTAAVLDAVAQRGAVETRLVQVIADGTSRFFFFQAEDGIRDK